MGSEWLDAWEREQDQRHEEWEARRRAVEEPPDERYDAQAELDAVWCDRCMAHHGGDCPEEDE
jgi:hypothetical protein